MNLKIISLAIASSLAFAPSAFAHPDGHDDDKALPKTCAQLADTARFTNDESYPAVKALRIECDAQKKPAGSKTDAKAGDKTK